MYVQMNDGKVKREMVGVQKKTKEGRTLKVRKAKRVKVVKIL